MFFTENFLKPKDKLCLFLLLYLYSNFLGNDGHKNKQANTLFRWRSFSVTYEIFIRLKLYLLIKALHRSLLKAPEQRQIHSYSTGGTVTPTISRET